MRFRRPKADYENIARLEHELDLDGSATIEKIDQELEDVRSKRVAARDSKRYSPYILTAKSSPHEFLMAPGARRMINEPGDVMPYATSRSVSSSASFDLYEPARSKIHLPAGVKIH